MYPEWIQEQLDKIAATQENQYQGQQGQTELTDQRLGVRLAVMESRIIHHLNQRFDRIEAKLDYFLRMLEDAGAE